MATSNSQRVSIIIILILFAITGVGGTILAVINSKPSEDSTSKAATNGLAGKPLSGFTPVSKVEKLQITDTKIGDGAEAKPGDTLTVDYTGAVAATGIVFQSSKDSGQPATFPLTGVIKGWQDGVPGMKVGGIRRLVIPAADAYGANPPDQSIPANADLVFDIELHKIAVQ